jgi:hypothetical protein
MLKPNWFPFVRKKRGTSNPSGSGGGNPNPDPNPAPTEGFRFTGGGTIPSPATWDEWIKNQPAPVAKPGHTMIPLGRYGFSIGFGLTKELADRWGYALELPQQNEESGIDYFIADYQTGNPQSVGGKVLKLAHDQPSKYQLCYHLSQLKPPSSTFGSGYLHDSNGTLINLWSPEASQTAMNEAVRIRIAPLQKIKAIAPISVIEDGGESLLEIPQDPTDSDSNWNQHFSKDPAVVAARGTMNIAEYISRRKAIQQKQVYDGVVAACPDRRVTVYYPCEVNPFANYKPGGSYNSYDYEYMRAVTDLPASSSYYLEFNGGLGYNVERQVGTNTGVPQGSWYKDLLTHCLGSIGAQIVRYSQEYSYNYVCQGWYLGYPYTQPTKIADRIAPDDLYAGFLKCYYTAGMRGGIAAYFDPTTQESDANYDAYNASVIPAWLRQYTILGVIHARFSWLEDFVLDSTLVPGPNNHVTMPGVKAYEIPAKIKSGNFYDPIDNVRVVARKHKTLAKWLVTAWVADGVDRSIYIKDIPDLPIVQVAARREGSIYLIDRTSGSTAITQQD